MSRTPTLTTLGRACLAAVLISAAALVALALVLYQYGRGLLTWFWR